MGTIHNPPLKKFLLRINTAEINHPTISTLADIINELKKEYLESIKVNIISSKGPIESLVITPLKILSKNKDHQIIIYKDGIFFEYNDKYTSWNVVFPQIIKIFSFLAKKLKISHIKSIALDYIDIFENIPRKQSPFKIYFAIELTLPPEFSMTYDDFIVGIKLETDESGHLSIIRLRGLPPENEDFLKIQLESHYSISEEIKIDDIEALKQNLNKAHENLINNFKLILTNRTKIKIGMENDTNSFNG
ncbi:MAG: TIGR04255 family protein [Candidatus Helarchaeota archaeon]